jgi:nucleoside-diphosphate-sugar epimerase
VGLRVARALQHRAKVIALTSSPERMDLLRAQGIVPMVGDLDIPRTLSRLSGLASYIVHMAPPPSEGKLPTQQGAKNQWWRDPRTQNLLLALRQRSAPHSLVYGSTSGVYGDCGGAWVNETRAVQPHTPRAQRRVDAERQVRHYSRASGVRASLLRIPGIYAADRDGGTPRARLIKGTPVLRSEDDVYTNHIHADDLARATMVALWRGKSQRAYNISDDSQLKMGDYFDAAADLYNLPRPPRVARGAAHEQLPLVLLSFMSESRRLDNSRMKNELRLTLRYGDVRTGLRIGMEPSLLYNK